MSCDHRRTARRAVLSIVIGLVVSVAHPAAAAPALQLSLDAALARASERSPEVALARHAVREAQARRVGAGVVLPTNPRLSFDARPPITGGPVTDFGYGAMLDFLFEVGGAPGARVREAERHADVARKELEVQRLDARVTAWSAYLHARIAEDRMAETRRAVEIAQRVLDASKERAALGASGDIEQSLAASEVAQLEAALSDASRQRDAWQMALRDALDMDASQPLELVTPVEEPGPVGEPALLVKRALAARPELALIQNRVRLLDATEERLEKEVFPRTGVYLGVDAAPQSPIFGVVGLSIELPFAQRNQGPRAMVEAARDGENERLALQARRIAREVLIARDAYEARRVELQTLTARALPAAEQTLALVDTGWRSGRFDVFRVTNAARDVARVRGLRLDALEAAWLERVALERAVGGRS